MNISKNYKKQLKRNIPLMGVLSFLSQFRLYYPIAILMYHAVTGSYTLAMSVFAVVGISGLLLEVPTGILSDKFGRKPLLIFETLCIFIATFCYAYAFSSSYGLYWLYVGAFIYGGVISARSGNREAIIFETLRYYKKEKEYPKIQGRMLAMSQSALALSGVFAGGLLWYGFSFQHLAFITLLPLALGTILALFLIEPSTHTVKKGGTAQHLIGSISFIAKHKRLRLYAMATILRNGFGKSSHTFMPGFIASVWPVWATPLFRTGQNGVGAISFWYSGAVIKKLGALKTLFGSTLSGGVFSAIAYILQSVASPFVLLLSQIGYAAGLTADSAIQQKNFTSHQRSTMGSVISFGTLIMESIVAVLIGYIADLTNPAMALLIILGIKFFPVNLIYAYLFVSHKKKTST